MTIEALQVQNVRSISSATVEFHPRLNLIWGPNGSGKTSLLESIYLLGRGRSFRTRNTERLISEGEPALTVVGRTRDGAQHTVGFQCSRESGSLARVDGGPVRSFAELSVACPTQVIDPAVHRLLEEGAVRRRQWLDWAVFHVEPSFIEAWTRYTRALKQRNAALRRAPETATAWDAELATLGETLATSRERVLQDIQPDWSALIERLIGLPVTLDFYRGWARDIPLADALRAQQSRDIAKGSTSAGAHRADVQLRLGRRAATETLSRGQQKLTAIALILAQLHYVQRATGRSIHLLLDDASAELDLISVQRFMAELSQLDIQQIWTGLVFDPQRFTADAGVFHVEQGALKTYNGAQSNGGSDDR